MKKIPLNTTDFILDKVAPVFNRQGYVGTSLSDITNITDLTKGAVYGNFENKGELALKAFQANVSAIFDPLFSQWSKKKKSLKKLRILTDYYRDNYDLFIERGGCPVLNVGIDSKYINPELFYEASEVSDNIISKIRKIIKKGIKRKEIRQDADADLYSKTIYSMIQGGMFLASLHEDEIYLYNILDNIDSMVKNDLKAR